jgi:hypothetical protein
MKDVMSPDEIKGQVNGLEDMLLGLKKLLESARRKGLPAWQLDIGQIETLVAEFEQQLIRLSSLQRDFEKKQPEFESLRVSGMELLERAEKFEIHNQADYEESQRFIEEATAQKKFIESPICTIRRGLGTGLPPACFSARQSDSVVSAGYRWTRLEETL